MTYGLPFHLAEGCTLSVSFRELGKWKPARLRPCTTLLQDCAYSCRVWITLIKLLYAPLQHPKINPEIFTYLSKYALGCYLRYWQFREEFFSAAL